MFRMIVMLVVAALCLPGFSGTVERQQEPVKEQTAPASERLTAEDAKAIALQHAGVTQAEVTRLRAYHDFDDGISEWEVEFRLGKWEYEYEIHAETGKILSWDKDFD